MKSLKEYENVETQPKGKHLRFQIAVLLFFLLIFISIFTIVRHQSSTHFSQEVVKSSSVRENVKKSEPVKKENKTQKESTSSQKEVVAPPQTVEAPKTPSGASDSLVDNNSQTLSEAPQSANDSLVEQSDTEQELRQQAIDEANQKAEEIAQSLASSAQEEGYIVNIERQ
ncbi:hypothetical protein [Lactococcus garvieae]|uniref:hypothetical protein n=1 Tax=Lactococcus garvieae TaxID=1363 RepID=UPI000381E2C0|nr:hypothetical protein [Lactococcus garvieae]